VARCEILAGCPFFNDQMQGLGAIKQMMKDRFCLGDCSGCARYMVFKALGKPKVPADLAPNQRERALALIGA
jgi:hypothetical protein